jgi:hypothetical protein
MLLFSATRSAIGNLTWATRSAYGCANRCAIGSVLTSEVVPLWWAWLIKFAVVVTPLVVLYYDLAITLLWRGRRTAARIEVLRTTTHWGHIHIYYDPLWTLWLALE